MKAKLLQALSVLAFTVLGALVLRSNFSDDMRLWALIILAAMSGISCLWIDSKWNKLM